MIVYYKRCITCEFHATSFKIEPATVWPCLAKCNQESRMIDFSRGGDGFEESVGGKKPWGPHRAGERRGDFLPKFEAGAPLGGAPGSLDGAELGAGRRAGGWKRATDVVQGGNAGILNQTFRATETSWRAALRRGATSSCAECWPRPEAVSSSGPNHLSAAPAPRQVRLAARSWGKGEGPGAGKEQRMWCREGTRGS